MPIRLNRTDRLEPFKKQPPRYQICENNDRGILMEKSLEGEPAYYQKIVVIRNKGYASSVWLPSRVDFLVSRESVTALAVTTYSG